MRSASVVAFDQFHDQRADRRRHSSRPWICGDVRMVERREDLRFALEAREPIGIVANDVGQDLDRDVAFQLRVARAIHLAHAAGAERRR